MPDRPRVSNAKSHKKVILEIECIIPKGVRINELEAKTKWYGPKVKTIKYDYIIPEIVSIKAKYKGRLNPLHKEDFV